MPIPKGARLDSLLARYDYSFPKSLIAQKLALPRDHARLLVYHRASSEVSFARFADLTQHLPRGAVLVFNETKVVPARLVLKKKTGGVVHANHRLDISV